MCTDGYLNATKNVLYPGTAGVRQQEVEKTSYIECIDAQVLGDFVVPVGDG